MSPADISEEVTDCQDIASIYFGLRDSSILVHDLRPNEIEMVQVYSTIIFDEKETMSSFVIGCTINNTLFQFQIITGGFGKLEEVLIE